MGARDLHELMRVWENIQRMWIAESHIRTMLFREETRWPGYYFRSDTPKMDEDNWKCFANCRYNPDKRRMGNVQEGNLEYPWCLIVNLI